MTATAHSPTAHTPASAPVNQAAKNAANHGVHALTPHLVCEGAAQAIDFYKQAFGAVELMRMPTPDGKIMHACIQINGSSVMLVDEFPDPSCGVSPKKLGGTPVTIHLIVDDVDASIARTAKAGAKVIMPAADMFWGDRYGVIEDPFGHRWSISTPQRQVSPEELKKAAMEMCSPKK